MRSAIFLVFCFVGRLLLAQSSQGEYLEAKRKYSLGNFADARGSFASLTSDKTFAEYASFYHALSSIKLGEYKAGEDMLRQIRVKYPQWEQQSEVSYWIAHSLFAQKNYWKAFQEVEQLPETWQQQLVDGFIGSLSMSGLDSAYALNPDNVTIGRYYADAIQKQPYEDQDRMLLTEIASKFDFQIGESLPEIKKAEYAVAVVLPFMFDSLATPQTVIRNTIIFDLYQGMKLAEAGMGGSAPKINLFPFDTKKKANVTSDIIKSGKLNKADVIIGPLFSGPSQQVSSFAKKNRITMINPLSSNNDITIANPYAFLFRPSFETQGREAAKYAAGQFQKNPKAFVFYETSRDSLIASAYRTAIEEEGYFVVRFDKLNNEDAQQIQKDFTEQYEVRLDTSFSKPELDSIAALPGRIVRTRSLRNEKTGRIIRDRNGEEVIETYEVKFAIQPDSIGHIFAATSSNLLANNLISMIEVRTDSIGLIGYDDWLNFSLVSYEQLERLQVKFLSASFYDKQSSAYLDLAKRFVEAIGTEPNEYHIYGYELIRQLAAELKNSGKYPQTGWSDGQKRDGFIMEGLQYGAFQDNQLVPITTLQNLQLVNKNVELKD